MSSFRNLLEQICDELEAPEEEFSKESLELADDSLPLSDQVANDILMHRNTHFGGKFQFMRDYYINEGIGTHPDFDVEDIDELATFESKIGQDLAPIVLSKVEQDRVKAALRMYQALRKIHAVAQDPESVPSLLVDLILSEEEEPGEIEKLAQHEKAMPYLLELLTTDEFFDPVFPGYGKVPIHAAKAMGKTKSPKAIIPLFENMREENFMYEEAAILALKEIGQEAHDFLLGVLTQKPITLDNEKAAIALMSFEKSEPFGKAALKMLQDFEVLGNFNLSVQLILACLNLKEPKDIESFMSLKANIPVALEPDFQYVSSTLKRR